MSSPSAVLTLGLGSWGSVSEMVTLGYGSGVAPPAIPVRGFVLRDERQGLELLEERTGVVLRNEPSGFILRD